MQKGEYVILIDGDNINKSYLNCVIDHVTQQGSTVSSICLFGKLNSSYLDDWRSEYPPGSIITKYNITENRKNSTDIRMLCEALSMYYNEHIKNFIILSSDRDMESVILGMPRDASVIIGYCQNKTAPAYLAVLKEKKIETWNLDLLRGGLDEQQIADIINCTLRSYLKYKLGNSFFSYDAIREWIVDRYPELSTLAVDTIVRNCKDVVISFNNEGCIIK